MNIRHGDLALIEVKRIPEGLTASDTTILMTGSGGNDHRVDQGTVYPKSDDQFIVGYLDAHQGCRLIHPDHGISSKNGMRTAPVPARIYELRRQAEDTHDGMKAVID